MSSFPPSGFSGLQYRLLLGLARAAVYWERLWPVVWPPLALALVFAGIAFLDILPVLPQWLHGLLLVGFAALFAWVLRRAALRLPAVSRAAARHRLEIDSGLAHRPLAALQDTLLVGHDDRTARRLWQRHQARMAERLRSLRLTPPSPDVAGHDRWALRAPVLLLLVTGIAVGWGDMGPRLMRAVTPAAGAGMAGEGLRVAVWITPPAYTRQAPVYLEVGASDAASEPAPSSAPALLSVPQGSVLLAQASGPAEAPDLLVGGVETPFVAVGGLAAGATASFRAETTLETPGQQDLAVRLDGGDAARWPLTVVADAPPTAEFVSKPGEAGRATLKVDYEAKDDYGLAGVALVIRHPDGRKVPGGEDEIRLPLPLAQPGAQLSQGSGLHDLSAHPWAGIEVVGRLEATDGRGQVGNSEDLKFLLPYRVFNHPVARALAEQRRRLSDADARVIGEVADVLDSLAERPDHFYNDTVVFLALAIARGRLRHDGTEAAIAEVQKLLWDTALRIEDGDFAVAERDLMELQDRLQNALRDGADSEEVQHLMDQLRQALDDYLKALTEQLSRQDLKEIPALDPNMKTLDSRDLQEMLDKARELARNGAMDAARQMLAQLQKALEQIRRGLAMSPQQQQQMAEQNRMMEGLRELTERQRQLLDDTFRRAQDDRARPNRSGRGAIEREDLGPPQTGDQGQAQRGPQARPGERGQQGEGDGDGKDDGPRRGDRAGQSGEDAQSAAQQEALRRALGDLMLQMDQMMGNIPPDLGNAERAMRGASDALRRGLPEDAVPKQTEALEHLEKSQSQMQQQMARQFGPQLGLRPGGQGQQRQQGQDPFGRGEGGAFGANVDGEVEVPSRMEMRRAREILEELRRRSGERERPPVEREYIDRLLRQF